jgi:hypothetical protein
MNPLLDCAIAGEEKIPKRAIVVTSNFFMALNPLFELKTKMSKRLIEGVEHRFDRCVALRYFSTDLKNVSCSLPDCVEFVRIVRLRTLALDTEGFLVELGVG